MTTVDVPEETHSKIGDIQEASEFTPTKKEIVEKAVNILHNEEVQNNEQQSEENI